MKAGHFPLTTLLLVGISLTFSSCGGREDSARIKENRGKPEQLKAEADQLADEAATFQQKIRNYGSSDTTSAQIVENLLIEEKRVEGEGARLERIAADLKSANESLLKEKAAYGQKYLKL